jgi:hypothetical protein
MAGLHFSCGKWLGGDKSANPFFEIALEELPRHLRRGERAAWKQEVERFFDEPTGEPANRVEIPAEVMRLMIEPARRYRAALAKRLGLSGPDASVDEIEEISADDDSDEFRYYCITDFIRGYEECARTGKPVVVIFC